MSNNLLANNLEEFDNESLNLERFSYEDMTFSGISWDDEYNEMGNYISIYNFTRSSIPIDTHAESEVLGTLVAVKQVKSDESKRYIDFKISFGGIVVKKLGLLDLGNSTNLGLIISSKLAKQLQIRVDKSKTSKV